MVLSDVDIIKNLGERIGIYPFCEDNVKGASYNLTASKFAWRDDELVHPTEDNKIILEPSSTTLVMTEEAVWVDSSLAGTYHSKVRLVSKGLGHISTTLDPNWVGPSLISVHNYSEDAYHLSVGASFVTLIFDNLLTPSTKASTNTPGRAGLVREHSDEFEEWLEDRNEKEKILTKLKGSSTYKDAKQKITSPWKEFYKQFWFWLIMWLVAWLLILGGPLCVDSFKKLHPNLNYICEHAPTFLVGVPALLALFRIEQRRS
ncbi:dCTP deaminase domain-containing protein [Halodesulfovibrio marinisediminis]|uniref:Deoxycytidine triphosphate deaminase n=1 Tax=Halodesulfovibrio marinisediminis DSM 17456 TaxID=1121457 RepID=A0A1N6IFL4_9BACT|nr:hypothetical protein [Halodesulfovibrio marinisediminis]SIO30824.1 Deoxycytidine triphosphate deaminase [Halodesulfovibrio marinisediminis DSM 17456]